MPIVLDAYSDAEGCVIITVSGDMMNEIGRPSPVGKLA